MLKIAVYSGVLPSTTFIERLIEGLSQRDVAIYLFGNKTKNKTYSSTNVIESTYSGKVNKLWRLIGFSLLLFFFKYKEKQKLDQWIKSRGSKTLMFKVKCYPVLWNNPDIFHLQWGKSIEDWIWVQDFGIKLVVSLRGGQINFDPVANKTTAELYQKYFPKVDGFHAVSHAIAKEATKYGADPAKIKVVYSGLPNLKNKDMSNEFVKELNTMQILSVGRNHWKKGYNYALEACAKLQNHDVDFHYNIIGAQNVEELEYLKNDLALNDIVTFKDKIAYDDVIKAMRQSDVILLPSVEEGIANVVLEAMQIGKIVVTTNCGGMDEVVKDGINGFVVPVRDVNAMCDKLRMISKLSKSEIDEVSINAQEKIKNTHSEEKMVKDMLALYNSVVLNFPIT